MDQWELVLCLTLLPLFLVCYSIKRLKSSPSPPSPPTLPLIGNLHQLSNLPHRSLRELSSKYGPLMLVHFGQQPVLVVSSSDVAAEIIRNDHALADKPISHNLKKIFYDGNDVINSPYGEVWRKLRRIMVHELLSSSRVKSFDFIREEEIALFVKKIEESRVLNFREMVTGLSNDFLSMTAFGKKHRTEEYGKKLLEVVDEGVGLLAGYFTVGDFIPWLSWIDRLNGRDAAIDRLVKKRDENMDAIIHDHLQTLNTNTSKDNIVDILLGIYKGDIPGVSIDLISIKGLIMDVFVGGTETSATTLTWIMTELIRHPKEMKTLQDEIRGIMKGKHHITDDDLMRMHYLKAVIKETLRLRPPLPVFTRVAREAVNIMGYEVAPRTMVMVNGWAIGRDPTSWVDPEKFMPERFLNSRVDTKGFHFELLPFGGGRRICPGMGFATIFIEHTVANLMLKFDWVLSNGAKGEELDVTERPGFTIGKKTPLLLVATPNCST